MTAPDELIAALISMKNSGMLDSEHRGTVADAIDRIEELACSFSDSMREREAMQIALDDARAEASVGQMAIESLKDPARVLVNMQRGLIAPISMEACASVHGETAVIEYNRLKDCDAYAEQLAALLRSARSELSPIPGETAALCRRIDETLAGDFPGAVASDGKMHKDFCLIFNGEACNCGELTGVGVPAFSAGSGAPCSGCGKPVYIPSGKYELAPTVADGRIWHGACFPREGVSGAGNSPNHSEES